MIVSIPDLCILTYFDWTFKIRVGKLMRITCVFVAFHREFDKDKYAVGSVTVLLALNIGFIITNPIGTAYANSVESNSDAHLMLHNVTLTLHNVKLTS